MTPEIEERFRSLDNTQRLHIANYSGVYFLCKGATVVYVGKARNVARRLAQHIGLKDFDTVMVMKVSEELLASVEMHWIRNLCPELNARTGGPQRPATGLRPSQEWPHYDYGAPFTGRKGVVGSCRCRSWDG
jgi:excinuclease UvrABC nuclease subunit